MNLLVLSMLTWTVRLKQQQVKLSETWSRHEQWRQDDWAAVDIILEYWKTFTKYDFLGEVLKWDPFHQNKSANVKIKSHKNNLKSCFRLGLTFIALVVPYVFYSGELENSVCC